MLLHSCEALFYCEPLVVKQLGDEDAAPSPEGVLRSGGVAESCWTCACLKCIMNVLLEQKLTNSKRKISNPQNLNQAEQGAL